MVTTKVRSADEKYCRQLRVFFLNKAQFAIKSQNEIFYVYIKALVSEIYLPVEDQFIDKTTANFSQFMQECKRTNTTITL